MRRRRRAVTWLVSVALAAGGCASAHRQAVQAAPVLAPPTTAPAVATTKTKPKPTLPPSTTTVPPTTAAPATRVTPSSAAGCPASLAEAIRSTGAARQLVTVEAPSYASTYATVEWWQMEGGCWVLAGASQDGRLGVDGFSDHHQEGQWTTPTGIYRIGSVLYGTSPDPGTQEQYHQLVCGDWWDEDPGSPVYNTFQHVPCGQKPAFGGNSEALWTEGNAYPSFAFVEYNSDPAVPGAGSAIFIHADIGSPTYGCVSLPLPTLDQFLRWLDPSDSPEVVMGPSSEITQF